MMRAEQVSGGPTVLRIVLGAQLRRLREAAGVSQQRAARRIRGSGSKISRMETGQVGFKSRDIGDLLTLYGVTDRQERAAVMGLVEQANRPGWWQRFSDVLPPWFHTFVGLEAAATLLRLYEAQVVPGLFQTEDYARAVLSAGPVEGSVEDVERRVKLRLMRQQILTGPDPPQVWAIIDEVALRRPVGGPAVLRGQLDHLAGLVRLPNVTLQVLPLATSASLVEGGPFVLMRFAEPDLPDVVYAENLTSALYLDKHDDIDRYAQAMAYLSAGSSDPAATAGILGQIRQKVGNDACS